MIIARAKYVTQNKEKAKKNIVSTLIILHEKPLHMCIYTTAIAEQYSLMFAPFPYEISGHKIYVHINAPLCIKLKIYDLFY